MATKVYERLVSAAVNKETEKAIMVNLTIDTFNGRAGRNVWLPKSCVMIEAEQIWVVRWMLAKKEDEIKSEFIERNMYGAYYGIVTGENREVAA